MNARKAVAGGLVVLGLAAGSAAVVMPLTDSSGSGEAQSFEVGDYTELERLVGQFRSRSPNVAAAFDQVQLHLERLDAAVLELQAPPPPPPSPPPPTETVPVPPPPPPSPPPPPPGGTAPWLGSFNASYQAAQPGQTIVVPAGTYTNQIVNRRDSLRGGTCSLEDVSRCITFVTGGPVQINGSLELHGSGIRVDGGDRLRVSGYADTEGDSTTTYNDHVVFENMQAGNIGVYSSTDVTFRNVDVGPSTVGAGCNRIENKIGFGSGIEVVPRNVLFDNVRIHDQNVNAAGRADDCHYGGLFLVTVDGLTVRNSTFEQNVVYHIQIQNFSGPPARNVVFDRNTFGCPVEWLDELGPDVCDGQRAIQFDYDPGTQFTLTNNVAANGPNGLYGCYVGTCGGLVGVNASGNVNLAASPTAPPVLP